ncbi:hypothetical protein VAZ01S_023_00815 [Vibrio azureus NBRC 104587]|uniref:Transposase n=1 Tax=Vibrio azureus NBRC 104587 TaxID=1219077 RepID=U3ANH5_9VIBR|nr:hypothetical protein VAZ01S_023_00815 [Vibrio azureus NBRC 104587]
MTTEQCVMAKSEFTWRHFILELILWCVRWYGTTAMSYANLSDMLAERGVLMNRSTIYSSLISAIKRRSDRHLSRIFYFTKKS